MPIKDYESAVNLQENKKELLEDLKVSESDEETYRIQCLIANITKRIREGLAGDTQAYIPGYD